MAPYSSPIQPEPPSSIERARALRADALEKCKRAEWAGCLEGLDRARGLDPVGDQEPAIGAARSQATEALRRDGVVPDDGKAVPRKGIVPVPKAVPPTFGVKLAPVKASGGTGKKSAPPTSPTKPGSGPSSKSGTSDFDGFKK